MKYGFWILTVLVGTSANARASINFDDLHRITEERVDIASVAFDLAKEVYPEFSKQKYLRQIELIAQKIEKTVNGSKDPDYRIRAMNTVLFVDMGFSYDFDDPLGADPKNRFLNKTLDTKKGNCYTLPLLYISLAQKLHYPIYPVFAPDHIFVRYQTADYVSNIEVAGRGGEVSDDRYIRDFKIPKHSIETGAYMTTLTYKEYLSELIGNSSAHWAGKKNFKKAEQYAVEAIKFRPNTPEYHELAAKILIGDLVVKRMTVTQYHPIGKRIHDFKAKSQELGLVILPREDYLKAINMKRL